MIYLRHPDHGTKVATMEMEAIYDEGNGWVRYNPGKPCVEPAEPTNVMQRRKRPARTQVTDDDSGRTD